MFIYYINNELNQSCIGWENGLEEQIDFSENFCRIDKPKICWPDIIDGLLDFGPKTCQIQKKDFQNYQKDVIKEYILSKNRDLREEFSKFNQNQVQNMISQYKYLAWPLTNLFSKDQRVSHKIQKNIIQQTQHFDNLQEAFQNDTEAVIDIQNLDLKINVQRNQDLVNDKKKIKNTGLSKNIIIIYIDTVSRRQTFRKLPKTMQFFKNYIKKDYLEEPYLKTDPNGKEYIKDKTSFEFFRYHSLDKKTFDNLFQLHYGYQKYRVKEALQKKVNEFDQNKPQKSLFNNFKDAGYIVAHAMNTCSSKCILRGFASKNQYKFKDEPADHELMILDPMYINRQNYFDTTKGINSIYRRCLYQKDTNEFAFEYGKQFLNQYRDENKVLYLEFTDGHEITSEVVQYIDDPMYKFLTDIEKDGHLQKDTMLYLLSDHGQHLVSAFYLFNQIKAQNEEDEINDVYQTERMLPMFYMLVTNDILKKHNDIAQNLENNSQSIFGMSELRETFLQNSFGIEKRKEMKKKEIENQKNLIKYQNKKNQFILKDNPDAIVEELEFVKKEAEFSIFQKLDDSRSCYDIGMTQLENPERFCSCKPQKKIE